MMVTRIELFANDWIEHIQIKINQLTEQCRQREQTVLRKKLRKTEIQRIPESKVGRTAQVLTELMDVKDTALGIYETRNYKSYDGKDDKYNFMNEKIKRALGYAPYIL